MSRIISDFYAKEDSRLLGKNPSSEFNQKVTAVNNMYGWLYENGLLQQVSFVYKDYAAYTYFAFDVDDLKPFRSAMEKSPVKGASLAIYHIFDLECTPCRYSGAIQPGWRMATYRNVDGCVGRSWECDMVEELNTETVEKIFEVKTKSGTRAAVEYMYNLFDWELSIDETKLYQTALEHFAKDANGIEHIEGVEPRKLIYCYENNHDLMDFDFWCRLESLCGEKLTFDEFLAINETLDGDPYDIEETDIEMITAFKNTLAEFRSSHSQEEKKPLSEVIQSASAVNVQLADAQPKLATASREGLSLAGPGER